VRGSAIQGRGVYALRRISKGTWVVEYTGELITSAEADRRYDDESMDRHHTFLFAKNDEWVIDASGQGSDARFINHSCEPNCEAVVDEDSGEIWIVALRDISAGEELSYDYGYESAGTDEATARRLYPCHCGSPRCRGTIIRTGRGPEPSPRTAA
jgi:SET domain-containing protein